MQMKHRLGAGAALMPLALGLTAGSALADGGGQAGTLVPDTPAGRPGQVRTNTVTPGYSYRCDQAGTMRRTANSYVIGWCTQGMHIDVSTSGAPQGYQGAWGEGNYQQCGWFQTNLHPVTQEGVFDHDCGSKSFYENQFANAINVSPTDGGAYVSILKNCPVYANVRPWSTDPNQTTGYDQTGTLNASTQNFRWRYRSKNDFWVLGQVRNNDNSAIYYDWGFVQRDCVQTPATRAASSTN